MRRKDFPLANGRSAGIMAAMDSTKYIYWQDQDLWLGYLQDYPDYWTQGESLEDLESHLRDLHQDSTVQLLRDRTTRTCFPLCPRMSS